MIIEILFILLCPILYFAMQVLGVVLVIAMWLAIFRILGTGD